MGIVKYHLHVYLQFLDYLEIYYQFNTNEQVVTIFIDRLHHTAIGYTVFLRILKRFHAMYYCL